MTLLIIWYKQTTYKRENGNFGENFNIINDTILFSSYTNSNEVCVKRDGGKKEKKKKKKEEPPGVESISVSLK